MIAIRPRTLFAAVCPVILGTALAMFFGLGNLAAASLALIGALAIQISANLANDYWDAKKGADGPDRLGPARVTSSGLLTPRAVLAGLFTSMAIACLAGVGLFYRAGWPILCVGVVSLILALIYTAGPYPLAYLGLGDIFTFVFFGLVATAGTFYVQTLVLVWHVLVLGCVPGLFSVALIALNNLRDAEQDRRVNKRTSAVRFGARFARAEIAFSLLAPALIPIIFWKVGFYSLWSTGLCIALALALGIPVVVRLYRLSDMIEINALFPLVGKASLMLSLAMALAFFV
jgi:1,4-dihydroxy-2-naphthoate polyprenyltransferase